jgi:hypothetical protein
VSGSRGHDRDHRGSAQTHQVEPPDWLDADLSRLCGCGLGWEAALSLNRYDTQRDANEPEIVEALRKAGCFVILQDTPCDLIVCRHGRNYLLEVKLPYGARGGASRSQLTPAQVKFQSDIEGKGCFHVVRSPEEALEVLKHCGVVAGA